MIEILNLKALMFHATNDTDRAIHTLERVLTIEKPGGFIRAFVDEGPILAHLLHKAAARKIAPDYIWKLLAEFPVPQADQTADTTSNESSSRLIEPLSNREIEVLRFVAKGLQRQEIASTLVFSLNTVKTHIRNIYSKLGVNNQMQAAARARALGLLINE